MRRVLVLLAGLLAAIAFGYFIGKQLVEGDRVSPVAAPDSAYVEPVEEPAEEPALEDSVEADSTRGRGRGRE